MTSRTDRQVLRTRNTILGFVVLVAILVIGFGTFYSTGMATGEIVAGEHYTIVDSPPRQRPGEPIVVHEYFSYACVHCRNFEPLVSNWQSDLPDNVTFARSPVIFSPIWGILAQSYYALDSIGALAANHDRLFRAIHDGGRQFLTADMVANFIDGNGTSKAEFLARVRILRGTPRYTRCRTPGTARSTSPASRAWWSRKNTLSIWTQGAKPHWRSPTT